MLVTYQKCNCVSHVLQIQNVKVLSPVVWHKNSC